MRRSSKSKSARSNRTPKSPTQHRPAPRTSVAPASADATNGAGATRGVGSTHATVSGASTSVLELGCAHALAGSLTIDGGLSLARNPGESESLSVTHGFEPGLGLVPGLHVRGDVILGRTPSPETDAACGFLTVAGGAGSSSPPALMVDGAIQSPPRASMLFVLRGSATAGMIALWSGHLLGDGRLALHDGAKAASATAAHRAAEPRTLRGAAQAAGAIGAFLGPGLILEPFGCDAVPASSGNHRLPRVPEFGAIEFGMGVVMRRSTLRLRIGLPDADGRVSDRLLCRGTLHLGESHLEITSAFLERPSSLQVGDSFPLLEAGSICGDLASARMPALPRGLRFALVRTTTTITLRVVRS